MKPPVPGRGEVQRTHLGAEIAAPITRCPKSFADQVGRLSPEALIVFPLILATAPQGRTQVSLSSHLIEQTIAFPFTEHKLSLVLNDLRKRRLVRDFNSRQGTFFVEL